MTIRICSAFRATRTHLLMCLLLVSAACTADTQQPPTLHEPTVHQLMVDGTERSYLIYTPTRSTTKELPLMVVLHGGLGNAETMEKSTGMDEVAESSQFIVAYPNGTGGRFAAMENRRTWNAGNCCGMAQKRNIDDVKFINLMLNDIEKKYPIDNRRVYVTGMSNGAMMAYRLACEIPDRIAAIIPVSGTLSVDSCDGANNVAILHIHGDQDDNVPLAGGEGAHSVAGVAHRSVSDSLEIMMRKRQCQPPEQKVLKGGIRESIYNCGNGAPINFVLIPGGKHAWPGGHGRNNTESDGEYFAASDQAWQFAKRFTTTQK